MLVGYDVRFWRELGELYGNVHLTDFLHRLRVQTWACAVQLLRRAAAPTGPPEPGRPPGAPLPQGLFWTGYTELVDALAHRDPAGAHAVVTAYDAHSLALLERLAAVG